MMINYTREGKESLMMDYTQGKNIIQEYKVRVQVKRLHAKGIPQLD